MPIDLDVPRASGQPLSLRLGTGDILFVLGANGAGKSALMHLFYNSTHGQARRITAHRQTWLRSNAIALSPEHKRNTEVNIREVDLNRQARWQDEYAGERASIALYDLIDAENVRARSIANAVDNENIDLATALSKKDAPLKVINELLRLSGLPIEISAQANDQIMATRSGGAPYSIAELSDGERNALLIAATVLTVKEGALVLIDEPERHLHRSIISPLLSLLFLKRPDCSFVVSTHEVMLPVDIPTARTLLVRGCTFADSLVTTWDADLLDAGAAVDEELKRDILGSRRLLLFVEGTQESLDKPLYSLTFPRVSVIARSTCRDVERAVFGVRSAADLHWLRAFGLVDSDRRTEAEIAKLRAVGVYALEAFSVESIYYHPDVQRRVAVRHAAVTGEDAAERLADARAAAETAIWQHVQRLSERAVERSVRDRVLRQLPGRDEIAAAAPINVSIDVASIVRQERDRLETSLREGNLSAVIGRYPVRETSALTEIAKRLGFQSRLQYESAVRKLLMEDEQALAFGRSLFTPLVEDIGE
jgi:ABC-type Mn2+/Zn2+ transport system ATPase subunit